MGIRILGGIEAAVVGTVQGIGPGDFHQFGRIPAVTAQDGTGNAHLPGLFDDFGHFFVIGRHIQGFRIGRLQFGQGGLEVLVLGQEGFLGHHFPALAFQGLGKHLCQAFGIVAGGIVVDGDFLQFQFIHRKSGQDFSLEGIGKADPENIGPDLSLVVHGDPRGGGRRGNQGHLAAADHRRSRCRAAAGAGPHDHCHLVLGDQLGGLVPGFRRFRFVVGGNQSDFFPVDAPLAVDFIHGHLGSIETGFSIVGHSPGQFEQGPDPDLITFGTATLAAAHKAHCHQGSQGQYTKFLLPSHHAAHLHFPNISCKTYHSAS